MRLTASNFGRIYTATHQTNFGNLAANFTVHKDISSRATNHGKKFEATAISRLETELNISTTECGLFVSPTHPFLAATPDTLYSQDTVVEVKCPVTSLDKPITSLTVPYLVADGDNLKLKENHNYYYQVQGQMFCSGRSRCLFAVYASTAKDIKVIRIARDDTFIAAMVEKLQKFYDEHFRSAVLKQFFHHNYSDYTFQPDSIFNDTC